MAPMTVTGLPMHHIGVAIVIGIILSIFILALTTSSYGDYEQQIDVSTPEPVYIEETLESDTNTQEEDLQPSTDDIITSVMVVFTVLLLCSIIAAIISVVYTEVFYFFYVRR